MLNFAFSICLISSVVSSIVSAYPSPYNAYPSPIDSNVVEVHMKITMGRHKPDGVVRQSILINGQVPGPTIRVKHNQTLLVHIENDLLYGQGFTLHMHGLKQVNNSLNDGVAFGTQRPVPGGQSFTYRYHITNPPGGTYWYHAHYQLQSHSVFGALIVEDEEVGPYHYDEEMVLLLSDWYHDSDSEQMQGLMTPNQFKWIGNPQSLLINGHGRFNCSLAAGEECSHDNTTSYPVYQLSPGSTVRMRLIAATSLSYLSASILPANGNQSLVNMKLIEADGMYVRSLPVGNQVDINSGQRYSVVFKVDANCSGSMILSVQTKWRPIGPSAMALLQCNSANSSVSDALLPEYPPDIPFTRPSVDAFMQSPTLEWKLKPLRQYYYTPLLPSQRKQADVTIVLEGKQVNVSDANGWYLKWALNGEQFDYELVSNSMRSLLELEMLHTSDNPLHRMPLIFRIELNQVIDIILQNTAALNGVCEQHPWHLHGHHFYDLGAGAGEYNKTKHWHSLNFDNPVLRDTITVYPIPSHADIKNGTDLLQAGTPCGWRVLRFIADNPGVWNMHCHIAAHMHMGMQLMFVEGLEELKSQMSNYSIDQLSGQWQLTTES